MAVKLAGGGATGAAAAAVAAAAVMGAGRGRAAAIHILVSSQILKFSNSFIVLILTSTLIC